MENKWTNYGGSLWFQKGNEYFPANKLMSVRRICKTRDIDFSLRFLKKHEKLDKIYHKILKRRKKFISLVPRSDILR